MSPTFGKFSSFSYVLAYLARGCPRGTALRWVLSSRPAPLQTLMPLEVLPGKKQVYRPSELWLYVHYQDSISFWDTFLLLRKMKLFSLYMLDNFFLKRKISVNL